jgi:hypothetical protein
MADERFWKVATPKAKVLVAAASWRDAHQQAMKLAESWATTLTCVTEWRTA